MKNAVIFLSIVSFLATLLLLFFAFFPNFLNEFCIFIALGICCILAAIGYTVGKKPYGYFALGDLSVFIFFGLVSVCGSYFLFTKIFDFDVLLPASAVGLLSVAVINLNNMRDSKTDLLTGKATFALKLGWKNAMVYQMILMQIPLFLVLIFMLINKLQNTNYYAFIFFILVFPMMALRRQIMETKEPKDLDIFLKQIGMITLAMCVLAAFGLNWKIL